MTVASARPMSPLSRISRVVMILVTALAAVALLAPSAQAKQYKRIVAISPFAAQTMVQLGAKKKLKAVGQTLGATKRQQNLLRGIRPLTLSHPNGPNLEVLAKLKPDLVFSSDRWKAGTPAMKRLGIQVVYADPLNVAQVRGSVTKVGRWIGRQKQARKLNNRITTSIRSARKGISGTRDKVLVVLGIGRTAMAFLDNSWGGQLIKLAGGTLVTGGASATGGFARISDEVVVAENPDRIIVVPHGNSGDLSQVKDFILKNEAWQTTNAFKDGNVWISADNTLLQAGTDIGPVIRSIRTQYLKNW